VHAGSGGNAQRTSLEDIVAAVAGVYERLDRQRSIWDVWLHFNHHLGSLAIEVGRDALSETVLHEFADAAMWLLTFVWKASQEPAAGAEAEPESLVRLSATLSDILWRAFPGVCPACHFRSETAIEGAPPCTCAPSKPRYFDSEVWFAHSEELVMRADSGEDMPGSADAWQEFFETLFKDRLELRGLAGLVDDALAQAAQVGDAMIRMYTYVGLEAGHPAGRQRRLEFELAFLVADVLLALSAISQSSALDGLTGARGNAHGLVEALQSRYFDAASGTWICHKCRLPACACRVQIVPSTLAANDVRDQWNARS